MGGTLWYLIMSEKSTWSTVWRSNPARKFKPHSGLSCSCSIYRCLDQFVTAHVPSTLPLLDHCATIMIPLLTMHMCQVYLFMFVEHHRSFSASTTLMNSIKKGATSLGILLRANLFQEMRVMWSIIILTSMYVLTIKLEI